MAAKALLLPVQQHRAVAPPTVSSFNPGSPSRHSCLPSQRMLATPGLELSTCRPSLRRFHFQINAAEGLVLGIEPDLSEDYIQDSEYKTYGEDEQDAFPYGKADGSHTWHEGDDNVEFFDAVSNQIKKAGGPNDHPGQATISWLFLPIVFSGMAFGVQPEYLFLAAVLFIFAFIGIEMAKEDKPSNFEYDPNFPDRGYKP